MSDYWIAAGLAFWFGLLTAISPCPMATNVAAISFISRSLSSPLRVLATGLFYALGRVVAYVLIAAVLVAGLLAAPQLSQFLQKNMSSMLGPILIVAGMFLLELIALPVGAGGGKVSALHERLGKAGYLGAFGLGFLFACAFCPVSAGLFFGSMLPLAVKHQSPLMMPASYGLATGLPVAVFALLIAFGAKSIGSVFQKTARIEGWLRKGTGVLMIAVGIYYSLIYNFGVQLPR